MTKLLLPVVYISDKWRISKKIAISGIQADPAKPGARTIITSAGRIILSAETIATLAQKSEQLQD